MRTWDMYSERNVKVFRLKRWKSVNKIAVSMNTVYAYTKANKFLKKFFHLLQFPVRREMTLENINSKSICLLNHNIYVFG